MRRPWNIPDSPVYSLVTQVQGKQNMNICTYVIPVSRKPKLYAIAIYNDTQTLEHMLNSDTAVLQLLHSTQYSLVQLLGKKSGFQIDKCEILRKRKLLQLWHGFEVLKQVSALIELRKINHQQTGDHVLFTFEAIGFESFNEQPLTQNILREKKIIRA
jgi:flavin reductase (DIM6/NTAB) family NADH-FMN oxidoreductase RutF